MVYTVSNEGTGNANNVIIIDKVPNASMIAYKYNVVNPEDNVNVTASAYDAGGPNMHNWNFYYTTSSEAELDRSYDGAGWVYWSAGGSGRQLPAGVTVTFVKFQKVDAGEALVPGEWARLQWSCYIR